MRLTRTVRNLPRAERKHVDTFGAQINVLNNFTPGTSIFPCRLISPGDSDFGERIGDKITLKSYTLNMLIATAATVPWETLRVAILQYKYNPDAATTPTSFVNMAFNSTTDNTFYNPLALWDWDNAGTFRKLYDKTFSFHATSAVGSTPANSATGRKVTIHIKFPKVAQECRYFNGGTAPSKNEFFVLFTCQGDNGTQVWYTDRLTYTDA